MRTVAQAGPGRSTSGKSHRRKAVETTHDVTETEYEKLKAGEVGYGGRVYSKGSLDDLARQVRKRGGNFESYLAKNYKHLGLADNEVSRYINVQRAGARAKRTYRQGSQ